MITFSFALGAWAMLTMWTKGKGLPASAFPPEHLVTSGPYAIVSHPIYVAAVGLAFGVSIATGSAAGVWIVAPTLWMATFAWLRGFENDLTRAHFGSLATPALRFPEDTLDTPSGWSRASVFVLVLLPWALIYLAVDQLGPGADALDATLAWERSLPVMPWTEIIYAVAYPLVLSAPFVPRTRRDLRTFALDGFWSMVFIFPIYLASPLISPMRPLPADALFLGLMQNERVLDSPAGAFPAYHVVWALIAARTFVTRWPRLRWPMFALCGAIGVSCVTTGMHGTLDVIAGGAMYVVIVRRAAWWRAALGAAERIANSWREWRWGPVRVLNHGAYAAIAGACAIGVQLSLVGSAMVWWSLALVGASIVGAGTWAQFVEGSSQLSRPYGYFGSVIGVIVVAAAASFTGVDAWQLFVSFGIGSTGGYAVGRLRCLVQGCCHGRPASAEQGIVYTHPRSRVVRLASLGGTPLYATPVYSLIWSLVVGALLLRLWRLGAALPFIAGCYFILVGLGRFVEEHYRGEPQTRVIAGLRLYQWLSIGFMIGGAGLTSLAGHGAPPVVGFDFDALPAMAVAAVVAFAAYGVDFPDSNRRLSRLA